MEHHIYRHITWHCALRMNRHLSLLCPGCLQVEQLHNLLRCFDERSFSASSSLGTNFLHKFRSMWPHSGPIFISENFERWFFQGLGKHNLCTPMITSFSSPFSECAAPLSASWSTGRQIYQKKITPLKWSMQQVDKSKDKNQEYHHWICWHTSRTCDSVIKDKQASRLSGPIIFQIFCYVVVVFFICCLKRSTIRPSLRIYICTLLHQKSDNV